MPQGTGEPLPSPCSVAVSCGSRRQHIEDIEGFHAALRPNIAERDKRSTEARGTARPLSSRAHPTSP